MSAPLKITNEPTRFAGLTAAEEERLHCLIEECGEVITAATKILRHGYDNYHPDRPGSNNRVDLAFEIGHVDTIVARMMFLGDVSRSFVSQGRQRKEERLPRWLHHHCKCGQPAIVWDANGLPMCQACKESAE